MTPNPRVLADLFSLHNKTAIITGAASGIGKATAKLFAEAGAQVLVADLDLNGGRIVADEIIAGGGSAAVVDVDISDESAVNAMAAEAMSQFGRIDILVNNAAHRPKAAFMDMSVDEWDRMHNINTRGTFLCMRAVIRQMKAQGNGGSIINISSIGSEHPTIFNNTHYDSSKSAVNALTRTSAVEFAPDHIRINAIMPGGVETEGANAMRSKPGSGFIPQGPIMAPGRLLLGVAKPRQLASAILFLASEASSYVTGQVIAVDGGYSVG